jgi:toxin ParE1/3/4
MPAVARAVKLHSEAEAELQASVSFYRDRGGEKLANRFKEHVEAGFRTILANPERFPPARDIRGVHKFRLKHFPFALLYIRRADHIWIVAVAHGSRKPGYWGNRVA